MKSSQVLKREHVETTVDDLIELFLATKRTEGRSENTLLWYRHMLNTFGAFLGPATARDVTLNNARAFVASLQEREVRYEVHPLSPAKRGGLSPSTIHGYVRTLKVFSTWLVEEGLTTVNALAKLRRPKLPETLIAVLADEEIERLFAKVNPNCYLGNRMYCILNLLLDTGIRASELCSLRLENVNVQENYIKVVGKGRKERIIPFGNKTKKDLTRYLNHWRMSLESESPYAFLDLGGGPVTYNNLIHLFHRLGKRAGVLRLHPHLLRHSFAVNYLVNGGNLMTLKLMLGHSSIAVTEKYLHLTQTHIMVTGKQNSYMDRLNLKKH
jgi:site-specific recombinase XerD